MKRGKKAIMNLLLMAWFVSSFNIKLYCQQPVPVSNLPATDGHVYAITQDEIYTYVGGHFNTVGSIDNLGIDLYGVKTTITNSAIDTTLPKVNGSIIAIVPDGSGGWFIGGEFTIVGGIARQHVAHILSSGLLDMDWNPNPNGTTVTALAVNDGFLYVGGAFTNIGGQNRNNLAKLSIIGTGAADAAWNPDPNNIVSTIAVGGGNIFIGGYFSSVGGQVRNRIAKIAATGIGSVDAVWNPNPDWWGDPSAASVNCLTISDNDLYVGGFFTGIGGQERNGIAKITTSGAGSADAIWKPNSGYWGFTVNSIAKSGNDIFIGGNFAEVDGKARNGIAKISAVGTGAVDPLWAPILLNEYSGDGIYINVYVNSLVIVDNNIFIGGSFLGVNGVRVKNIAKISLTGAGNADETWALNPNSVKSIAVSGSTIYVGGSFIIGGQESRRNIFRFETATGIVDRVWNPGADNPVNAIAVKGNDVFVGGIFGNIGGKQQNYLAKLSSIGIGSANTTWNPNPNGAVYSFATTTNNQEVFIGGEFTNIGGQSRKGIAKFSAISTGEIDAAWNPDLHYGSIYSIASNGDNLFIGGFLNAQNVVYHVAKLSANGSGIVDLTWKPNYFNGSVNAVALGDGSVYVGGTFTEIGGRARNNLAKLSIMGTGELDTLWNPNANEQVKSLVVSGGSVYAGGIFTSIGGQERNYLAKFSATGIGAVDANWNPSPNNVINTLATHNNNLYVGGFFSSISGDGAFHNLAAFPLNNSSLPTATFSAQIPSTSGIVGVAYTAYTFVADGTPAPTYSVASGSLPTGLTLSAAGVLSGTPTSAGSYTFTVQASNSAGSVNTSPITITVNEVPSVFSAQTPATSGVVGTAFASYTFVANGNPAPTYSVASGTLPTGLTLSSAGILSGTPTVAGSYTFTVQASNSAGSVNSSPVTITVNEAPSAFSKQTPAAIGVVGTAFASYTFVANGTPAPTYSVASGTLPTGLTLSSAGILSGTPTVAGSYTFTVQASNSAGNVNSSSITIAVTQAPSAFSSQTPATSGVVGTTYMSYTFVADGTPAPTYSVASGTLSTGLTLSSVGVLSGTPTVAGSYTFTVQASNSAGNVNSTPITITVNQVPSVFSAQTPISSGVVGTAYASYTFIANGSPAPTYSLASGSLPTGLTLSSAGVLSGAPTAAGTYTFAVQASNSAGNMNSSPITITVTQVPSIFSAQMPATSGVVGTAFVSYTFVANGAPTPTYNIASGSLPTGLALSSTGILSGIPTVAGTYTFTIQATNSEGSIISTPVTIVISNATQAPNVFSAQTPITTGIVGTAYTSYAFVANGNPAPTYSVASGTLPTGLTLSSAGILSGTPTVAGTYSFTVQASNSAGALTSSYTTITITAGNSIYESTMVTTIAGSVSGYVDGTGTAARFYYPYGVALDGTGNMYVVDAGNNRIRKISPSGIVTTFAGNGVGGNADGTGTSAQFSNPVEIAIDAIGNIFVVDQLNHSIRKITSSGVVTTFAGSGVRGYADGTGTAAQFSSPTGIATDGAGNVYVADIGNHCIRKITSSGVVTTLAGSGVSGYADGTGILAQFAGPTEVATDAAGNIYVTDSYNNRIRKITPSGVVTTLAGSGASGTADGVGTAALFTNPYGITTDGFGNVYVSEPSTYRFRKITPSGVVTTLAGSAGPSGYGGYADGTGASALFLFPTGITTDASGNIFAADGGNHKIRKITVPPTVGIAPTSFSAQSPASSSIVGTAYISYTFVANGSPAPTYSVASGTLPAGLTLSSAGVLSGTPTVAGSYTFAVQASNVAGSVNSASITITVTQPTTSISSFAPASATVGNTVTIRGTGFTGASVVRFGGTAALSFVVASDTVITARVGTGASGAVSVTTPLGTASLAGFLYNVPPAPVAGSFSPMSARPGDTVVIRGVNFLSASTVSFGGVSMLYTVVSDSVIRAYISASAVSGSVNVITQGGTSNMNGFTFIPLPPAPRITSFTPNRAAEGASVVITGTNLTGATRVKFGAFDAASFMVNSATQITAVVGAGSSGAVSVQTAGGTFSLNGFTFVPPSATITAFTPTSAAIGTTVVITGTNLSSALAVEFGGRSAVFTVNSNSQITATVPAGALSGTVSVTTLAGAASLAGFTFLAPPVVSGFTPTSAGVGASVVIAGSNFSGADTVRIGGVVASFVVNSASQITATVPAGAASGSVSVRTPYGTGSLAGFVFIPSPAITSFSPAVAGAGDVVTINGTNFTGASAVSFGGVPAASFTVVSATRITAAPSASGASGDISVTTPNGTGTRSGFSFAGVPVITAFSPTGATGGDTVTITGTNFVGVSTLTFGNTAVTSFTIVSPTQIKAVVSPRGSTGAVRLVTPGGTASLNGFTFTAPAPVITGFSPASATVEQTVTITGRNFAGDLYSTLAVSFGGRAAGRFTVVNDSTITAAVGGGATGSVSVRTPGGTANRAGFTFIPAAPVITGFTPASAPAGATITISGNNFFGASAVRFGGIAATNLVVVNDSTVTVRVAASGASGVVTLTTPSGTATSASAFTFIPAPVISALAPATASVGDTVSIAGTGFTGATAVRFGGTAALRFTVVSDTEIQAVVNGGSTGAVTVVSPNGTGTLSGFTYLPPAPRITSFTPATAAAGTSVVINGNYFTGATAVNFGGVAATSFVINSATRITAVVAAGSASGDVTVTSPNGTGTRSGFTFLAAPPAIVSFSPTSAPAGGTVLIRGTGFTGATAVRFGGSAAASFTRTGDTLISARVSASGASGDVSVVSVAGTGTLSGFVFIPAPSISSFTPTSAAQGDTVTIAGANFLGATAVSFGGAAANIVSVNATQIVVLVGSGASGSLSLTTPGGSASKTGFTYLPPGPRITGFTPATATPGTSVVISGSSFTGATAVSFGGIAAQSFVVNSATRITAVVPATALSGNVSVTTPLGTASMAGFTFTPVPAPVITSFTPTTMPSGSTTTTMTINGRNFTGATAVSVGGVAVPFTVVSATRITARLTGAFGGAVSVTTPGGTATMAGFVLTSLFDMKSWDNLTSANGNGSNSNAEELNVVTGVSNLDAPPLTAFPNPASESVTLTGSGFAEGRLVSLTLVNALGQTVMTLTQQPIGGILQANVDVRHVPSGAYTAVLSDGVLQRAVRFVKR